MFKHSLAGDINSFEFLLIFLCMTYLTLVVSSIVLFTQILKFNLLGINISLSGALVPYVFLYPISFIVLRVFGFKYVNRMISSMILASLIFVIMSKLVVDLSSNSTGVYTILDSSFQMYLAGFIGMPAGIYTGFLMINFFNKIGLGFNFISITLATFIGEIINTIIVFPIGLHEQYSFKTIFTTILIDALIFKFVMGLVLAFFTVLIIKMILNSKLTHYKIL